MAVRHTRRRFARAVLEQFDAAHCFQRAFWQWLNFSTRCLMFTHARAYRKSVGQRSIYGTLQHFIEKAYAIWR